MRRDVTIVQGGIAIAVGEVGSGAGTEELGHGLCFAPVTGCGRREEQNESENMRVRGRERFHSSFVL